MSMLANRVRRGFYLDSVALMRISRGIAAMEAVEAAALMIGTTANKALLEHSGLLDREAERAQASDLVIAIRATDASALARALAQAEALLDQPRAAGERHPVSSTRRLGTACRQLDGANLALVSIPGEFAAREARLALMAGLNVVLFSDNVAIEDEIALKRLARERGLLMMGPDCGTCLIGGVPIAFANAVPRGRIGIVSASGTGLQEVSTLIARGGGGVAHGIGVGGRDLSTEVAGLSTLMAIDALEDDPLVERIALISKPPAAAVINRVLGRIGASRKSYVVCFMGSGALAMPPNAVQARSLRAAAEHCLEHPFDADWLDAALRGRSSTRGGIRGLFCGGTLCAEAQAIALEAGLTVASNAPVPGARRASAASPCEHLMLDLGDDDYTRGRPHPMIEPEARSDLIAQALTDPTVAVLLLDVVIGYGAHTDPAAVVADALRRCERRNVQVLASVTGTEQDPQRYSAQCRILERAGVTVAPSNAHAAELAIRLVAHSG
jgi:succinyl-CoA synthetase alpha subunit